MNKLQILYGIALRQNVDKIFYQMKVALAVNARLYDSAESVKNESC